VLKEMSRKFLSIGRKPISKPIVGVVGEIYIRSNRFSNDDLVRKVEDFGGQVWLAPVSEWISYVNYVNRRRPERRKSFSDVLNLTIADYIQRKDEHHMEEIFVDSIKYGREPRIRDIINKARPYIHESFEGEAILSVGKAIDFIDKGVSGIINAMPFSCMPGTISSALMRLIQNKFDVPIINVAYDGQGSTNTTTRLEAFMYQVKEQFQANE
jgi:predicted nucleotide-binding protein (sugar kinase/HSP70/actin superfamily)